MTVNDALSAPDTYVWEPLQRRFPVLYLLDGDNWETWIWHGVLTYALGTLFGLIPHAGGPVAWTWAFAGLYALREASARWTPNAGNLYLGWRYKQLDGTLDVLFPIIAAVIRMRWFHP